MLEFLLNKVAGLKACNFMKKDSNTGVFHFKNTYFEEHLGTAALNSTCIT